MSEHPTISPPPLPPKRPKRTVRKWDISLPQSIAFVGAVGAVALLAYALPAPFWESLSEKMPWDTAVEVVIGLIALGLSMLKLYLGGRGIQAADAPAPETEE